MERYLVKSYIKNDEGKYIVCEEALFDSMKEVREYIKNEFPDDLCENIEIERLKGE
ncbi:hypothetical protein Xsto_04147 [Xenorhabdus stockiae]|uniref:Uncharacterized protein n=1 Tax=Xenorhabdus stockiae TaxID=351614 RepID=A0A2D0K3H2_9GAMM|nr:hypothetical protein [Xenorhabdus stockiae]PHM56542.1 hypothetical protein Xsto_04147 [Xenorhabdus stockiae]